MKALICYMTLIIVILQTNADQNLIHATCKTTPDYNLCTAIFRSRRPASDSATDVADLGLIVADVLKHKTTEALSIIAKLRIKGDPKLAAALRQCKEVYRAVLVGDMPVMEQTIRGNPKFAETAAADTAAEASICDEALGGAGDKSPELRNLNRYVGRVAGVARAIIRNLL